MKRFILLTLALALCTATTSAAPKNNPDDSRVKVTDIEVSRVDDIVKVFFTLHAGKTVTPKNQSLIIVPVLRKGGESVDLQPIAIRGEKAKTTNNTRALAARYPGVNKSAIYTANGKFVKYSAEVPFEEWMSGSELFFEGISAGKGKATVVEIGLVADNLMRDEQIGAPVYTAQTATQTTDRTQTPQRQTVVPGRGAATADQLAGRFQFLEPMAAFESAQLASQTRLFDYNMPLTIGTGSVQKQQDDVDKFVGMTRAGALTIRFRQGNKAIAREFDDNNRSLVDLISVIRAIEQSSDSKVTRIVVVGFSAPEGTLNENEKLAQDRAAAAKDFITANTATSPDVISVYNGSVDWGTLRELVAGSDMPDKYKILEILDNTPVWDSSRNKGRQSELMALGGGEPYRYMQEHFFPKLRQMGAYIKVYYDKRP